MSHNNAESYQKIKFLKVEKLINENEINILKINSISNLLRTLLIISINQYTLRNANSSLDDDINHKFENAILINLSFLFQFDYAKIQNMILNNNNIITKLQKYSFYKAEDLLNLIFKDLDANKINDIEEKLKLIDTHNIDGNNILTKPEKICLFNDKQIDIYNNFVIINISIMSFLIKNFNLNKEFDLIEYISYNEKFL